MLRKRRVGKGGPGVSISAPTWGVRPCPPYANRNRPQCLFRVICVDFGMSAACPVRGQSRKFRLSGFCRFGARQSAVFGSSRRIASKNHVTRGSRIRRRLDQGTGPRARRAGRHPTEAQSQGPDLLPPAEVASRSVDHWALPRSLALDSTLCHHQILTHAFKHAAPFHVAVLPIKLHGRIPGAIVSIQQPPPIRNIR